VVCLPRLCTGLLHCGSAFDASVLYIHSGFHSGFRDRDRVDRFLCHRWEPSLTVSLSTVRQMVLCEMVVSQQLCTAVCPLRLAQIRGPQDRIESVSVMA
jgi:hypothetical protein